MSTMTVITARKAAKESPVRAMQFDPWSRGYGHAQKVMDRGVQYTHVGGYRSLYYYGDHESVFRTCMFILRMYHFREGLEFTNQVDHEDVVKEIRDFFENCNTNGQTFHEILQEIEDDLNVADDAYLCLNRNYTLNKDTGEIIHSQIRELYRGDPTYYRLVSRYNSRLGGYFGRCLVCEATRWENNEQYMNIMTHHLRFGQGVSQNVVFLIEQCDYDFERDQYLCPVCNCKLYDVKVVVTKEEDTNDPWYFHIDQEVIHSSKYTPSKMYGTSPIVTLWNQMDTKMKFTQYLQSFLDYNRAPKGAIFINTGNASQVEQTLNQAEMKYQEDRYFLPIFAVDSTSNGTVAQYIQLTPFPKELQQIELQNSIRREIAALLGVQNVMMNDLEGVGGLNSESLQVQVTDRAALAGQLVYNTKFFPRLMKEFARYGQFDIPDDLRLIVKRTDNAENEIRMVNFERQINLALSIKDLGYDVEPDFVNLLGDDNKKLLPFNFRKLSIEEIRQQQELGLIDRGDKADSPSQPNRARIPAFRTKQLVERNDAPIGVELLGRGDNAEVFYKVRITDYELGYVREADWTKIEKQRGERRQLEQKKKKEEEVQHKIKDMYNNSSVLTKSIINIASFMLAEGRIKETLDDPYKVLNKAVEVYVRTQNRIETNSILVS